MVNNIFFIKKSSNAIYMYICPLMPFLRYDYNWHLVKSINMPQTYGQLTELIQEIFYLLNIISTTCRN